jgi:site-specific recombinase XerD
VDRGRISGTARSTHCRRKRGSRRPPGLDIVERDGHWHIRGTLRVAGNSRRVRKSTELPATPENREYAEALRVTLEREIRDEVVHGVRPSIATAVACDRYLRRPRRRPVGHREIAAIREIDAKFGQRKLNTIGDIEWQAFVDDRQRGNSLASRERYITAIRAFLNWCRKKPRKWIAETPEFERDREAARPPKRRARRVNDLTLALIMLMLDHAAPHLKAQLVVEWCTGARVSSVLYHCRLCDVILVGGRGQITFHDTKNSEPVVAALNDWAVERLIEYLEVRGGRLDNREQPFFLTDEGLPFTDNGKTSGGQNKSAFKGMKRRTIRTIRERAAAEAWRRRRAGDRRGAVGTIAAAKDQAALVAEVTQHWFRHKLATEMMSRTGDLRAVMEQGGWRDVDSVMGYIHDVPARRRELIDTLPIGDTRGRDSRDKIA